MMFSGKNKGRSFSERNVVPYGYGGTAILLVVLLAALSFQSLPLINTSTSYAAEFTELGGLNVGDDVVVGGLIVGSVDSVDLRLSTSSNARNYVKVSFSITDSDVKLGKTTAASIGTITVLGRKALEIDSQGSGTLAEDSVIPLSRTTPPYDITDDLQGITGKVKGINTTELAKAFNTISDTFKITPAQLKSALTGVDRLSQTLSSRDSALQNLLQHANSVTGVLASRNREINLLLTDGASLFRELTARRTVLDRLFQNVSLVATQLNGLASDQRGRLKPALMTLNKVLAQLNVNRKKLESVINGLGRYAATLGDAVGTGPFFDAYVENLSDPASLLLSPGK